MNTLYVILLFVLVLGLCVFGLCFNIIFRKNGKFPDSEIGHSKELRKRGVICMREEDERIWGKSSHIKVTGNKSLRKTHPDSECESCDVACKLKDLIAR